MINSVKKYKNNIFKLVGIIVFFVILSYLFVSLTYLFRGTQYGYKDRISVVGIKEEPPDSIDVVYIGGSAAFVYWEPLKAYYDYGFTSYDLATNTIQAESILPYVKHAQKYQNPELYIIGVRAFQYYDNSGSEVGLRVTSDSLDLNIDRFRLISKYLKNRTFDTYSYALYWDIAMYHNNYDALKSSTAWNLIDNSMECDYKGCQIQTAWCYLEKPHDVKNDERAELLANNEKTLIELLDYLKKNDLNALFVVCPYSITAEDYTKYNTISDIVSGYGYNFLNTNDYYEEMGIDFSTDFYNTNHVNSLGAEKYTSFLGRYLVENYNLPNRIGDEYYVKWQELADQFALTANESKSSVMDMIAYADEIGQIQDDIRNTNDLLEWSYFVKDKGFTVIATGNCDFDAETINNSYKKALDRIGLSNISLAQNYIRILCDSEILASNMADETRVMTSIGYIQQRVPCVIDNTDNAASITINNVEYSCMQTDKINIVIFDNYHRNIVDSVYLDVNEGRISLLRK